MHSEHNAADIMPRHITTINRGVLKKRREQLTRELLTFLGHPVKTLLNTQAHGASIKIQPDSQPAHQTASQPVNQPASQQTRQPDSQSAN